MLASWLEECQASYSVKDVMSSKFGPFNFLKTNVIRFFILLKANVFVCLFPFSVNDNVGQLYGLA